MESLDMFPPGPIVPSGKLSERAEILKKKIKNVGLGSSPGSSKEVQKAQEELNDLRQKKKGRESNDEVNHQICHIWGKWS